MARGETTQRSDLDATSLVKRLRAQAVAELAEEPAVWAIVDMAELRKPYARELPDLMKVRALEGERLVPGYRTLQVLGVGTGGRRGILHHRLFSSTEATFTSESQEIQTALTVVAEALANQRGQVTYLLDSGFDDVAVWGTIWGQGNHLVCRLKHRDRRVEMPDGQGGWQAGQVDAAVAVAAEVAQVRTELLVRKRGQKQAKRQPTTVVLSAARVRLTYQTGMRTPEPGPAQQQVAWVVVVRLEGVAGEPWVLLTDWPVTDAAEALQVFRMYRMRWAIEDSFKFTKETLGWEDVQVMDLDAIRTLVALAWVAAGFLYHLGITLDWPEVQLLARLGGWEVRANRPPGRATLARGLQRLLDHLATHALLQAAQRDGPLPPRLAALLGDACPSL